MSKVDQILTELSADLHTYYRGTPKELTIILRLIDTVRLLSHQVETVTEVVGAIESTSMNTDKLREIARLRNSTDGVRHSILETTVSSTEAPHFS